jgi:serine/threonine-protein kinase
MNRERKLSIAFIIQLIRTLLQFAVEAEKKKLVHRDIKPENIMIDISNNLWILDFGIARHLEKSSLTMTQDRFGPHTAGYAAPEQFRNLKRDIDIRADLFTIGIVAYEAFTGENPFRSGARDALAVLYRTETLLVSPLIIPGDSQNQLSGFIRVLIEKFPSRRPPNAETALNWFNTIIPTLQLP